MTAGAVTPGPQQAHVPHKKRMARWSGQTCKQGQLMVQVELRAVEAVGLVAAIDKQARKGNEPCRSFAAPERWGVPYWRCDVTLYVTRHIQREYYMNQLEQQLHYPFGDREPRLWSRA
jgi:hypothetical protein